MGSGNLRQPVEQQCRARSRSFAGALLIALAFAG
jgi:hypothetical protein